MQISAFIKKKKNLKKPELSPIRQNCCIRNGVAHHPELKCTLCVVKINSCILKCQKV